MEGDADFNTELVQQNQEQEDQQTMEDQQLPPSVSETNLEDPGAGHIVSGDSEPVREDDIHENDMVKKGESDDEVSDFGAVNLKGESRDTTHLGDGDLAGDFGDGHGDFGEREDGDFDDNLYNIRTQKDQSGDVTRKKKIRKSQKESSAPALEAENPIAEYGADYNGDYNGEYNAEYGEFANEDPAQRKRRLLEEKMDMAVKNRTTKRRRADEDDLERMQDDKIDFLKNKMIEAANLDVEKNSQGLIATEKLKLLREVMDTLSKADLAISILDNNLLEAVRLWLEPLPDSSMPAYQIQKELLQSLVDLPIKTDHLVASGIGKVLVFYQRSKRTEPILKKLVDKLIGEWTRPILNKSDSYKDRTIHFNDYNKSKFTNKLASKKNKTQEQKTLYEQQAERRKRAAIPSARTTAYKIAPKVDPSLLMRQQKGTGEMFNRINRKMTNSRKKVVKKSGPSVEGKHLSM